MGDKYNRMIKKMMCTAFIFLAFIIFGIILFRHIQSPNINDVYKSTRFWSEEISEVYTIEKIDNNWIAFFRIQNFFHVSKFEKNWMGSWKLVDWSGREGTIGSTAINFDKNNGIVFGSSAISNFVNEEYTSFYFGLIINPDIDKMSLEIDDNYFTLDLFQLNGYRVFFFVHDGKGDSFRLRTNYNSRKK